MLVDSDLVHAVEQLEHIEDWQEIEMYLQAAIRLVTELQILGEVHAARYIEAFTFHGVQNYLVAVVFKELPIILTGLHKVNEETDYGWETLENEDQAPSYFSPKEEMFFNALKRRLKKSSV